MGESANSGEEEPRSQNPGELFDELVRVMARLRGKDGCPWDREQDHDSLKRYLLEETYEFFQVLDEEDPQGMEEELGDLLLQVLFHSQIAREEGTFSIEGVMERLREKLVRRHPHVFGDANLPDANAVLENWERLKAKERREKGARGVSLLSSVPRAMAALARAQRVGDKASHVGFDWKDAEPVWKKIGEELAELKAASESGQRERVREEVGDVLFSVVNLCRFLEVPAEDALAQAVDRFENRFAFIEERLRERDKTVAQTPLAELDSLWEEAKKTERKEPKNRKQTAKSSHSR